MRFSARIALVILVALVAFSGCRVYSFSGASIDGKTINIHQMENRARNIVPSLSATLTDKIRRRILSQTGLKPVNTDDADYDISGKITTYEVTVTAAQSVQQATRNRLTIAIEVTFENKLDEKANFTQTFTRFSDFSAAQTVQSVEAALIEDIGNQLADDIFNKAFVNW